MSNDHVEAPDIRIAYTIIQQAIRDSASEILLEAAVSGTTSTMTVSPDIQRCIDAVREPEGWAAPTKMTLRVSEKIGGEWREAMPLPVYLQEPITRRFKQMADVDLAVTDRTQQGRIPIRWGDKQYDLLLTTTPSDQGEIVHMLVKAQ